MKTRTTLTRETHTQAALLRRLARGALARHRHRAAAVGQVLSYGQAELEALAAAAKTCCYCKAALGFDLQFDHRTPTSRPGGDFALSNLVVCCRRCNLLKGQLDAGEFRLLRELLAKLHPAAAEDLQRRLLAGGQRYSRRG